MPKLTRRSFVAGSATAASRVLGKAFGGGMQSTWGDNDCTDDKGWGKDSVAVMFKHYVGAGAVEGGRNDHNDAGKYDVFPGDNFNAHLIPFLDGGLHLESETGQMAAVMPNYGIAYTEDESLGPIWGGAYNARNIVCGLLARPPNGAFHVACSGQVRVPVRVKGRRSTMHGCPLVADEILSSFGDAL